MQYLLPFHSAHSDWRRLQFSPQACVELFKEAMTISRSNGVVGGEASFAVAGICRVPPLTARGRSVFI